MQMTVVGEAIFYVCKLKQETPTVAWATIKLFMLVTVIISLLDRIRPHLYVISCTLLVTINSYKSRLFYY